MEGSSQPPTPGALASAVDGLTLEADERPEVHSTLQENGLHAVSSSQQGGSIRNPNPSLACHVPLKHIMADVEGEPTEFFIASHDDRLLVMVTQIGTVGTILHAKKDESVANHSYGTRDSATFSVAVLLGKRDEPLLVACARQLVELLSNEGLTRPLVLSLGLKQHTADALKTIIRLVMETKAW